MISRTAALRHLFAATAVSALVAPAVAQAQTATYALNIPAQDLGSALKELAGATGQQVTFRESTVRGKRSNALDGCYTIDEAFAAMTSGEGVTVTRTPRGIIVVAPAKTADLTPDEGSAENTEIVVTGTHIRGGNPASPVRIITRKEIDTSGASNVGDLIRTLPESFSGGQNPGVFAANTTKADNTNISGASTINLRGLGTDATLVLLNGHRLAADSSFQGADISIIPLGAIQSIQIMTDGGSAVYGSDAVAGVANFITRKDFQGAELTARLGAATQGGGVEDSFSALAGLSGSNGYALLDLEYSDRNEIRAGQRDFTATAVPKTTLYPAIKSKSAFLTAGKDLSSGAKISFDGSVYQRSFAQFAQRSVTSPYYEYNTDTKSYTGNLSLDVSAGSEWNFHGLLGSAGSRNRVLRSAATGPIHSVYKNAVQTAEISTDGTLITLPTGAIKVAAGAGYRREAFAIDQMTTNSLYHKSRGVTYAYAEIRTPLVNPSPSRPFLNELELSASGRAENYSDFGHTENPKLGVRYVPFPSLTLRGTWGKSYKAPSFSQLYFPLSVSLFDAPLLGYQGTGTAMVVTGGNPNLRPEKATSWTAGGDITFKSDPTLKFSATYFDINYRDRILTEPVSNLASGLSDPIYAPFVQYDPSADEQSEIISDAISFRNFATGPYDPSAIVAVLQDRSSNATFQSAKGVDISYRQTFDLRGSSLNLMANGTWLKVRQKSISGAPISEISGTIFNVPKFKARGGVTWNKGGFSATGLINFVASESDNAITPHAHISPWTTADLTLSYDFGKAGSLRGFRTTLAVTNLLDKSPPRTVSSIGYPGIYFDSTNASAVGRFMRLSLTKAW
jgi:outer membrane receptor protein involved in Fe transport